MKIREVEEGKVSPWYYMLLVNRILMYDVKVLRIFPTYTTTFTNNPSALFDEVEDSELHYIIGEFLR